MKALPPSTHLLFWGLSFAVHCSGLLCVAVFRASGAQMYVVSESKLYSVLNVTSGTELVVLPIVPASLCSGCRFV